MLSYHSAHICFMGRDSSVGVAIRYGLDGLGMESRYDARISVPVQNGPEAHPGTGSFPGIKWPGSGVDHDPHLVPRLKKE